MGDILKRIAKWNVKYSPERLKAIAEEMKPSMLENVHTVFSNIVAMETQVKQVLDGEGVATIQYPFYLCFARELWHLQRKEISGDSLAREVAVLMQKWVARGLAQPVLEAIRTQVFNIAPPGP